jgi:cytochrome c553
MFARSVRRAFPTLYVARSLALCAGLMTAMLPSAHAQSSSSVSTSTSARQTLPDTIAQRVVACTACHGKEGRASSDGFYPRIAGKPEGYLFNQLTNFRDGRRQYPLMTYLLDHLSDAYLHEIANYFSEQHPPYPPPQLSDATPAVLERGRNLVMNGDSSKKVPACIACHGQVLTGVAPAVPGLIGLPRDYINSQFGAWRNGVRKAKAPDCMAQITQKLTLEDINAASSWLAAQTVPEGAVPAPATTVKLPLACGSVTE